MKNPDKPDEVGPVATNSRRTVGPWPPSAPRHVSHLRVEFGDCDPATIVYFPNYYRWFDQATHALCEAAGYGLIEVRADPGWVSYPIAEAGARFRAPASTGDHLRIETRVRTWHERFFDLEHRVFRDEQLLVEGWQTRFIGIHDTQRGGKLAALPIPAAFRAAVTRLAGGD